MGHQTASLAWTVYTCLIILAEGGINTLRRCDPNNIVQCLQPMHKHVSEMGGLGETYDLKTLEDICEKMNEIKECTEKKKAWMEHCNTDHTISWEMFQKGFGYLCGEGYKEYAQNERCLSNTRVNGTVKQCSRTWARQLHAIILQDPPRIQMYKRTCRILQDYRNCLRNGIERFCSKDASHVMVKMWDLSLGPFRKKMMCSKELTTRVMIAVIMGVMSFVLVSLCVVCFVRRRQLQSVSYKRFTENTTQASVVQDSQFPSIAEHALRLEDPVRTNELY